MASFPANLGVDLWCDAEGPEPVVDTFSGDPAGGKDHGSLLPGSGIVE